MTRFRRNLFVLGILFIVIPFIVWQLKIKKMHASDEAYARQLLISIMENSSLHLKVLSEEDIENVSKYRSALDTVSHRALKDSVVGTTELGYCFNSGAFVYMTFRTGENSPKASSVHVYEPGSHRATICQQ